MRVSFWHWFKPCNSLFELRTQEDCSRGWSSSCKSSLFVNCCARRRFWMSQKILRRWAKNSRRSVGLKPSGYVGPRWVSNLYTSRRILNLMRCFNGSQYSLNSIWESWSYFDDGDVKAWWFQPLKVRKADCCSSQFGMLKQRGLVSLYCQESSSIYQYCKCQTSLRDS